MGVWEAIANKMEASQEHVSGANITQVSLHIIKGYVPKKKVSIQLFLIFESLCRNWKGITLIYGGLGAIAPRNQRHFKESIKMEA